MKLLEWISPGRILLMLVFGLACVLGYNAWADHQQEIGYQRRNGEQVAADLKAEKSARDKETKWQQDIDGVAYDAQEKIDALETQLVDAGAAADRLRNAAKLAAQRGRANTCTANTSQDKPGADPLDLLVNVLDRHSRELVEVGGYADRLRIAGLACERAYGALMP